MKLSRGERYWLRKLIDGWLVYRILRHGYLTHKDQMNALWAVYRGIAYWTPSRFFGRGSVWSSLRRKGLIVPDYTQIGWPTAYAYGLRPTPRARKILAGRVRRKEPQCST